MTRATRLALLGLMVGLACACRPSASPAGARGAPRSWIDAPLPGSTVPLGPVEVVSHSSHPEGIAQVELSVNGTVVASQASPDPGQSLVTTQQRWQPGGPGRYVLRVRARDGAGTWGASAQAEVTVKGEDPTATATPLPTATPAPTPAPTATPLPTAIAPRAATATAAPPTAQPAATAVSAPQPTPAPVSKPAIGGPNVSTAQFFYGGSGCGPQALTVTVRVTDASGVAGVRVYLRLLDKASSATTPWAHLEMAPGSDGWTSTIVAAEHIPGYNSFAQAWFQFYFVATNVEGGQTKSPGYWTGFTLSRCGSGG